MFGLSNETVHDIHLVFQSYPNIQEVLIFGSRAKGDFKRNSDIDLAIKGENISFD